MNDELAGADDTQSLNDIPQAASSEHGEIPTVDPDRMPKPLARRIGPGLPAAIGWSLLLMVLQIIFGTAIYVMLAIFAWGEAAEILLLIVATATTLLLAATLTAIKYGRTASSKLAIRLPNRLHSALLVILVCPLFLTLASGTELLAVVFKWAGAPNWMIEIPGMQQSIESMLKLPTWAVFAYVLVFYGIVPGVGEELFFRGYIGRGLIARWGRWMGVLLTSFLFGLVHLYPLQAAFAAVMGVILHVIYLWTRSLIAPMFLHAVYNSIAILWTLYVDPQINAIIAPYQLLIALFATVGILLVLFFTRLQRVSPSVAVHPPI